MKKLLVILAMLIAFSVNAQWEPYVRLSNSTGSAGLSFNNAHNIVADGNILHTVWHDTRSGITDIWYKRSTDGGTTWGTEARLTNNTTSGGSWFPSIAASGSIVHIVWQDVRNGNREIYYKRSTDGGVTWSADTRLTNKTQNSYNPSIAVSGSTVHTVFHDQRNGEPEIYYKQSIDGGATWGSDIRLSNNSAESDYASIAVLGSIVHIVWRDFRDGNFEIYYKRSQDAGISFGAETRLTNNSGASVAPNIAVSGSVVYIVWDDGRDGAVEIYGKRSIDGGITWGNDLRLTTTATGHFSQNPFIAISGSNIHLVWTSDIDATAREIYYKRSQDGGVTWGTVTRLTNDFNTSNYPSIEVSGSVLHVVYIDNGTGYDVCYLRNQTGNVGVQNISTEIPSSYSLGQNYPNPFNPITKIKFSIANGFPVKTSGNDKVVLKVYDVMGREVQTLVNESLKPGTYETSFDGSALNSGVYFYKLMIRHGGSSTGFSETKKMLMIK